MTRAFDQRALQQPDIFENVEAIIELAGITVSKVPVKAVRKAVVEGHYSRVMPDACQEAFGAFDKSGKLVGAVAYGQGSNNRTFGAIMSDATTENSRELIRLWVHQDAPKNTASTIVSKSMKLLSDKVKLIVTFADSGQSHVGTVYQALNFYYLGTSNEGTRYVDQHGVEVTSRLANVYRQRNPEKYGQMTLKEIRNELGWSPVLSHKKHRYALGHGIEKRKVNKMLSKIALPYPKKLSTENAQPVRHADE